MKAHCGVRAEYKYFAGLFSPLFASVHIRTSSLILLYSLGHTALLFYFGTEIVPALVTGNSSVHTRVSLTLPQLQNHLYIFP